MPTNSITDIKNYFSRHRGLQRANRFDISFQNLPAAVKGTAGTGLATDSSDFYPVLRVMMGGRGMEFVADNLSGYKFGRIQPRGQLIPEDIYFVFPVTNDCHILTLFNNWFNYLYSGSRARDPNQSDPTKPFTVPYYDIAVKPVNMTLRLLDPNGNPNLIYTFYEVMPASFDELVLDMDQKNADFLKIGVKMAFKEFTQTVVASA